MPPADNSVTRSDDATRQKFAQQTKIGAVVWLLFCAAMVALLLFLFPHANLNNSVLALLPKNSVSNASGQVTPEALTDNFLQRLDEQVVWLVSPDPSADEHTQKAALNWLLESLNNIDEFKDVSAMMSDKELSAWGDFAYVHRYQMIDSVTRERLQEGAQAQWILSQLYTAFAGVSGGEFQADPLLLVRGAQLAQMRVQSALQLKQGWLTVQEKNAFADQALGQTREWYFIHARLAHSSHASFQNQQTVSKLKAIEKQLLNQ